MSADPLPVWAVWEAFVNAPDTDTRLDIFRAAQAIADEPCPDCGHALHPSRPCRHYGPERVPGFPGTASRCECRRRLGSAEAA